VRIRAFTSDGEDGPDFEGLARFGVNDIDEIDLEIDGLLVTINIQDLFKVLGTIGIRYI
jgi:hypothetical protein